MKIKLKFIVAGGLPATTLVGSVCPNKNNEKG